VTLDLAAYLARIGLDRAAVTRPGLDALDALVLAHQRRIPFENLDIVLGRPIHIDLERVFAKLVTARRGGYCFEHNTLFGEALRTLGFEVVGLAARVVWNTRHPVGARTHMVLRVRTGGEDYISDVGFGGLTLTGPLRLELDTEQETPHERFRLRRVGDELELAARVLGTWRALYRFDLQAQLPIDFEALNHFVATHPSSHFLTTLMAARRAVEGRYALTNNELIVYRGSAKEERKLRSAAELARALTEELQIALPQSAALDRLLETIAAK
jgi:N-hydroxyarylamine O-acetyltransferase